MDQNTINNLNNTAKEKEERNTMTIVNENGTTEEVEIIVAFEFTDLGKEYVVYTKNEVDANDNVTVYISTVESIENGEAVLGGIETDEEWSRIKDVLRELAKEDSEETNE